MASTTAWMNMWIVYDMICLIDGTYVHECTQDEE